MTRVGYLYVTRSAIDDMLYIGQSSKMDERSVATYLGSGDYFKQAIAEHGAENFSKTVLDFYDDQAELDYAEVHTIARLRAEGFDLYNGGVGGPRAQQQFIRAMFDRYRVVPVLRAEWFEAVAENHADVRELIASGGDVSNDEFYRELEAQYRVTQDLSGDCSSCGSTAGAVCRTKTGNPAQNHAARRAA